jgi:hypothetical protein
MNANNNNKLTIYLLGVIQAFIGITCNGLQKMDTQLSC